MPDKEIIHEEEYKHTVESNRDKAGLPKLLNKTFNKIQPFDYDFGKDQSNLDEEQEQEEATTEENTEDQAQDEASNEDSGEENASGSRVSFRIPIHSLDGYHKNLLPGTSFHLLMAYSREDDFTHHSMMRTSVQITI